MTEVSQPEHRSDFEIAIICALPSEAGAVELSFDEYWDEDGTVYGKATGDPNTYTAGRIGRHNVVLAWMPGMGNTSAANVASSLRSSFSNIRLALVVGICGGVPRGPNDQEIILGDVIISNGLVQYDFGRQYTDGFKRKSEVNDTLGRQNQEIRGLLNKLQVGRSKKRLLAKTMGYLTTISELKYPGATQDRLFPPWYRHKHQNPMDCEICKQCVTSGDRVCDIALKHPCAHLKCAEVELITRKRLEGNAEYQGPMVHYGKIASGNQVVMSGEYRDRIAAQEEVIGFEMEGAGVWDNFPCIVIKGVCDYADSHKSYDWQAYAATTAAAVSKAFLGEWIPSNVPGEGDMFKKCLESLWFPEMDYRRQEVADTAQNSSLWIFQHESYTRWLSEHHGLLWITGKPGSGKSTLMKLIFNNFKQRNGPDIVHLAFFFHRRGTQLQQTEFGMLRTLLYQVLQQVPTTKDHFQKSFKEKILYYGQAKTDWNWDESELRNIFKGALLTAVETHSIFIFVDALDEGGEALAQKVVEYLDQINDSFASYDNTTHICFSCRHWPVISINRGYKICLEDENSEDISLFASQELQKKTWDTEDASVPPSLTEILDDITEKASGVFLWVALVIPKIAQQYNNGDSFQEIQNALFRVPADLKHVFEHILIELKSSYKRDQSLHLMQWICLAEEPLTPAKLRHALASDDLAIKWPQESVRDSVNFVEDDARMRRLLGSLSGGLAEVKSHWEFASDPKFNRSYFPYGYIQFIHQSVLDYMLKDGLKLLDISSVQDPVGKGHDRLAKSCLNYLRFGEVRTLPKQLENEIRQMQKELPFINYAARNWPKHSKQADQKSIDQSHIIRRLGWHKDRLFVQWTTLYSYFPPHWEVMMSTDNISLLHVAAAFNIVSIVKYCLNNPVIVEAQDAEGNKPLHYAARSGHYQLVKMFINAHAEVEVRNKRGDSPLQLAASGGHKSVLRLLLDAGPVLVKDETVLCAAVGSGSISSVKLLLDRGADAKAQDGVYGNALCIAAIIGDEAIARLLIKNGADVNAQGGVSGNALCAAAITGDEAIARLLIENGADISSQDGNYKNALYVAARSGNEAIARLFVENGADINTQDGNYNSALYVAASSGHEAIARLLIENGADVNAQGGEYGNALCVAARWGHEAIVRLLIEKGAKPESVNQQGQNALHCALRSGFWIPELLEELDSPWTDKDNQGRSSMHFAASGRCVEGLQRILGSQGNINNFDLYGWTAAHWAARSGSRKCCMLLKAAGCDFTKQDNGGFTAAEIAIYCHHDRLHDILDPCDNMIAENKIVVYEKLGHIQCSCCFHEIIGPYLRCCQEYCYKYYLCFRCLHFKSELHPEHEDSLMEHSTHRK